MTGRTRGSCAGTHCCGGNGRDAIPRVRPVPFGALSVLVAHKAVTCLVLVLMMGNRCLDDNADCILFAVAWDRTPRQVRTLTDSGQRLLCYAMLCYNGKGLKELMLHTCTHHSHGVLCALVRRVSGISWLSHGAVPFCAHGPVVCGSWRVRTPSATGPDTVWTGGGRDPGHSSKAPPNALGAPLRRAFVGQVAGSVTLVASTCWYVPFVP